MIIIEDPTLTVKCRTAIKVMFFYFKLCLSVMLASLIFIYFHILSHRSRCVRDRMIVGFTTTCEISAYLH